VKVQAISTVGNRDVSAAAVVGLTNLPSAAMMTHQLPGDVMRISVLLAIVVAIIVIGALWRRGKPPVP
jgi:hypothetical protein